ncbi:hypothetical protein [Ascidiimonas sp. W6]|uniref:hypothetical protein n=1 Tax=Ascidiimonas meishanensis TaxID=3128903 RepID=UPI0030EBB00E
MNLIYKKWLDLKVSHGYFPDAICKVLTMVPFRETEQILKNYDILLNHKSGTFSFFIGRNEGEATTLKEKLQGISDLYFTIKVNDTMFYNYTEIPFPSDTKTLFFENNQSALNKTLQKNNHVGMEDQISIRAKSFSLIIPDNTTKLMVKDGEGDVVFEAINIPPSLNHYQVQLRGASPGIFELWMNDELIEKFLYLDNLVRSDMGILRLAVADISDLEQIPEYNIDFKAREVFWQYKIASTSTKTTIKKMLVSRGKENVFEGPQNEQLPNGQEIRTFLSSAPMMLQEELEQPPLLSLNYTGNFSSEISSLELKLPNPQPMELQSFKNQQNESHLLVSTIVYV